MKPTQEEYKAFHEKIATKVGTDHSTVAYLRYWYFQEKVTTRAAVIARIQELVDLATSQHNVTKNKWQPALAFLKKITDEQFAEIVAQYSK